VPKVVCRVLRQRTSRGEVGKGGREGERHRGFLGGEQDGTFAAGQRRLSRWLLTGFGRVNLGRACRLLSEML
jgi:hypothetical protein